MAIALLLAIYCICVVLASLLGGVLPRMIELTHRRMQLAMSFVGGLMLGVALLHLLPHALAASGSIDQVAGWTLGGLLANLARLVWQLTLGTAKIAKMGGGCQVGSGARPLPRGERPARK